MKVETVHDGIRHTLSSIKMKTFGVIDSFFHKCDFKMIGIPTSNEKGTMWMEECKCGKKQKVLFDSNGRCVGIIKTV